MLLVHTWECNACGEVIQAVGPIALLSYVKQHALSVHGRTLELSIDAMVESPFYHKPDREQLSPKPEIDSRYTRPYGMCSQVPTYAELQWLKSQGIAWYGDNRNT